MDYIENCCGDDFVDIKILKFIGEYDGDDDIAMKTEEKVIVSEENGAKKVTDTHNGWRRFSGYKKRSI